MTELEAETQPAPHQHDFEIAIDRVKYVVHQQDMTGTELRNVPTPPIGPERDLYEEVGGGKDDLLIENDTVVHIHNNLVFFTTPHTINPG